MTLLNTSFAPGFDPSEAARTFASQGHVRLHGALPPDQADAIAQGMAELTGWKLTCAIGEGSARLDPAEIREWPAEKRQDLNTALLQSAQKGEGFSYLGRLLGAEPAETGPQHLLEDFKTALMGPDMLGFIQQLTGMTGLNRTSAQATRFGPGHYLTRHNDAPLGEGRQLAFVWGFTPNWHPDWGGLLQFYSDAGEPERAFAPGFNTLDLFTVQKVHAVTFVAPYAGGLRSVVSGWYHS
ncbi:MAG: 2OG-Fe(II) oxygenase [Hyphomonadaceae bacterium]|nr:2OG-Fe(II) oxygenase [Hyphomonadaceae bacterium]